MSGEAGAECCVQFQGERIAAAEPTRTGAADRTLAIAERSGPVEGQPRQE
jgi:hypothetical protein